MYSNPLICDILIYINENINSEITINHLEKYFFYNRFYIMKLFKKEIGLTIIQYINCLKIYKSIEYLKIYNTSLIDISIKSGFHSLEYFSETFKHITKLNPKVFKNYFNKKFVSDENMFKIESSIIYLFEINNIKNIYLSKRKPKIFPVKKLTIFK